MTKIEQLNWAKQILADDPTAQQRDAAAINRLSAEAHDLRMQLETMALKRDNALARLRLYQRKLSKSEHDREVLEVKDSALSDKLAREEDNALFLRLDCKRLKTQLAELKPQYARLQNRFAVVDSELECARDEIKRLKLRVNELVRKGKVAA